MKLKMSDLLIIRQGLNEIGKLIPPSGAIALAFARIGIKIRPELESLGEAERAILLKYVSKDKEGNPIRVDGGGFNIPDELWNEFENEKKALMLTETEDIDIPQVKWADIENMKGITPFMIESLDKILNYDK